MIMAVIGNELTEDACGTPSATAETNKTFAR
jgi:hypothetical protein